MATSTGAKELQVKESLLDAFTKVAMESGIYKNILQEMTHIAGFALPDYFTTFSLSGHDLFYRCTIEIGGISFEGEPAETERQAEKNAAMAALSVLKQSKISIGVSSLDRFPSCSCGHGYMVLKTSRSKAKEGRQFWVCPSTNGEGGCGRRLWIDQLLIEDIFHVPSDDNVSESVTIDELKEELCKLSASIKCDVAKVNSAIDNLKGGHKLSASMDAIDDLKEKFDKLSASIKCDVAQVHFAVDKLNQQVDKLSASKEEIEASVSCENLDDASSSVM